MVNDFLASVDIKAFCHIRTHLQCCFFLASHFFMPRVFLFSISLLFVNINKCYSTLLVDYSHSIDHKQMICIKFQVYKPYWCMNVQWKFKEIMTWNFFKITFIMFHNCCTYLLNTFKCLLLAESCFTGRAYIGELLMQIWLKSMKK